MLQLILSVALVLNGLFILFLLIRRKQALGKCVGDALETRIFWRWKISLALSAFMGLFHVKWLLKSYPKIILTSPNWVLTGYIIASISLAFVFVRIIRQLHMGWPAARETRFVRSLFSYGPKAPEFKDGEMFAENGAVRPNVRIHYQTRPTDK